MTRRNRNRMLAAVIGTTLLGLVGCATDSGEPTDAVAPSVAKARGGNGGGNGGGGGGGGGGVQPCESNCGTMHVDPMYIDRDPGGAGADKWVLTADAWVLDSATGLPIEGAEVTGFWTGCFDSTESALTAVQSGGDVYADVPGKEIRCSVSRNCHAEFTITDVVHPNYLIDWANSQTVNGSCCNVLGSCQ